MTDQRCVYAQDAPQSRRDVGLGAIVCLRKAMCNLYSLNKTRQSTAHWFRVSYNRAAAFEPSPGIFPRHVAPIVR